MMYQTTAAKNYISYRNTAQVVKLKMQVLQLLNVKSHNIMSNVSMKLLLCDRIFLSQDRSLDLIGVLSSRATLFECLHLSLGQVPMM